MASELRRRVVTKGGDETPSESSVSVAPSREESPVKVAEKVEILHHQHKSRKRRNGAIFLLGSLFGIIAAGFFAKSNDLIDFPGLAELRVDSLLDVLPAGLVKDVRDLVVCSLSTVPSAS